MTTQSSTEGNAPRSIIKTVLKIGFCESLAPSPLGIQVCAMGALPLFKSSKIVGPCLAGALPHRQYLRRWEPYPELGQSETELSAWEAVCDPVCLGADVVCYQSHGHISTIIRIYSIAEQSLRRLYFFTQACLSRAWFKYPIEVRTRVPGLVKVSKARHAEWHEHAPIVGCCTSFYCCGHK